MVELKCNSCSSTFYLNNVDKYTSKYVTFKCKNCGENSRSDISAYLELPKVGYEKGTSQTEIVESGNQYQIAKIMISKTSLKHYLTEGEYSFGRSSDLKPPTIEVFNDTYISRKHFIIIGKAISKTKFEYRIKDNDSKNGTWLNGARLKPSEEMYLQHNDEIRAGETRFSIVFEQLNIPI